MSIECNRLIIMRMSINPLLANKMKQIPNTFLRKKRKWPHSPYKTQWHYTFNQQQALQSLKTSTYQHQFPIPNSLNPPKTLPFILNCLIDSFSKYNCEPTPIAYHFVIKTLVRNSQSKDVNFVLTHLQKVEKFETPERFFVDLIRVYGENGMVYEAIDLFFRIPSFRCVPTANSLNSVLVILCRNRELLGFVPQLLLKSRVMNVRIEESSFSILINALCRIGRVDYAVKLLYCMVDDGLNPDDKVCSLILSSLCQVKGVSSLEVMGVLEGMKKIGFCPGRTDFHTLVKFFVKQGKGRDAFDVLCEMKREGIKPDIVCYTMVLHGLVEGGEFTRAEELFDEILVFGLIPDVRTYNVYINGLCKQKKVDAAYTMMRCMHDLGCEPNSVTYRIVLEAFCKVGDMSKAREVWREIKLKGVGKDSQMYVTMIDALVSNGEVIEACNLFKEMLSNNSTSLSSTLDDVVCSLCHLGLVPEVLHTLERVCAHGGVLGSRAWEALLLGLNLNLSYKKVLLDDLVNMNDK